MSRQFATNVTPFGDKTWHKTTGDDAILLVCHRRRAWSWIVMNAVTTSYDIFLAVPSWPVKIDLLVNDWIPQFAAWHRSQMQRHNWKVPVALIWNTDSPSKCDLMFVSYGKLGVWHLYFTIVDDNVANKFCPWTILSLQLFSRTALMFLCSWAKKWIMQNHGGRMRNHGLENACFCSKIFEIAWSYLLQSENPHFLLMESLGLAWKCLTVCHAQTAQEPRIMHLSWRHWISKIRPRNESSFRNGNQKRPNRMSINTFLFFFPNFVLTHFPIWNLPQIFDDFLRLLHSPTPAVFQCQIPKQIKKK